MQTVHRTVLNQLAKEIKGKNLSLTGRGKDTSIIITNKQHKKLYRVYISDMNVQQGYVIEPTSTLSLVIVNDRDYKIVFCRDLGDPAVFDDFHKAIENLAI